MKHRNILITGASSGIGKAIAIEYAKKHKAKSSPLRLLLLARREKNLHEIKQNILNIDSSINIMTASVDVNDQAQIESEIEKWKADEPFEIDTLYANAGFALTGKFESLSTEDFKKQFSTNVFGLINSVYACIDDLKKTSGKLALLGSVTSFFSEAERAPYAMSKFAVRALADSLYYEYHPNSPSVTLVCPGLVESEIRRHNKEGQYDSKEIDRAPNFLVMPANKAARKIISGVEKRKKRIIITNHGKATVFLERHLPGVLDIFKRRGPL